MKMPQLCFIEPGTPACHASTVAECPDGTILVAWFGGSCEGKEDVKIHLCRISGTTPGAVSRMPAVVNEPHWNPVLFAEGSHIQLFYKGGPNASEWRTWVTRSNDAGVTWSAPAELVKGDLSGGRGPVKNKCIKLADGTIAAPASTEFDIWRSFVDRSIDGGATWTKGAEIPFDSVIQPTLWESAPGKLHAFMRSTKGRIIRADSADGGMTWISAGMTRLPNNNSGIDLVQLKNGELLLLCNPVAENWGPRTPLRLLRSQDGGEHWRKCCDLIAEPGEYSYPAIIQLHSGEIFCTFTHCRSKIAFARFKLRSSF